MVDVVQSITWEAPEHAHVERGANWFWIVGIIGVASAAAAIILGDTLFGVVILLGTVTVILFAQREPKILPFAVTTRGIRMGSELFPYSTLESFHIDDENPGGPQLIVRSNRILLPLLILPIPEEYLDEIDDLLGSRLPEEHLEEPLSHKLLELFDF